MTDGPRYGRVDREYGMRLATTAPEDDGPVWMVNLMHYRERASYEGGGDQGLSGREADDRYTPTGPLAAVGAEIVFVAEVEGQSVGDEPRWDRVAVVKYPTRRSFVEMQQRDDFQRQHVHKEAGMAQTIVMGCLPVGPLAPPDGGPVRLHVVRYAGDSRPDSREGRRFRVEGTIIGDGRSWDEVRFEPARSPPPDENVADGYVLTLRPLIDRLTESSA